jgi:dTDP-4-dehydrorhamnose reductase
MLGHRLWQTFPAWCDCAVTVRGGADHYRAWPCFNSARVFDGVDAFAEGALDAVINRVVPDVVVNCIGIVKQVAAAKDPLVSIRINSMLPHLLARACRSTGCRLIHLSTDCVFSGRKGNYSEDDLPDPPDLYGRSKLLGEVDGAGCLTIRTSIIGHETGSSHGLLEWFLGQSGPCKGYRRALFSGFTTDALAGVLELIIRKHPDLHGVWHVAAEPISKHDLLQLIGTVYGTKTQIDPDDEFMCDRTLNSARFRSATGFRPSSWPAMIAAMRSGYVNLGGERDAHK